MPTPGWYPDPAGSPGMYRYWDGQSWTQATTTDPASTPAPVAGPDAKANTVTRRGHRGWIMAIIVVVVAVAVIIAVALTRSGNTPWGGGGAKEDTNSSSPTGSQWDETSTPTPTQPSNASSIQCPVTTVTTNTTQKSGTLTSGNLQVDRISGWRYDSTFYLSWVSDLHSVADQVYPGWMSDIAVGTLNSRDGFTNLTSSAHATLECYASSGYYEGFTGRKDLVDEQTTVDGHTAWRIQTEVTVSNPTIPQARGDRVDIYVIDVGSQDSFGLFIGSSNLGDAARNGKVDDIIKTLKVGR